MFYYISKEEDDEFEQKEGRKKDKDMKEIRHQKLGLQMATSREQSYLLCTSFMRTCDQLGLTFF